VIHDQFRDKKIALVGNSSRILERRDGAEIDAHEVVIRFNLAWPEIADQQQCTGARTTHMMVGGREFKTPEAAIRFDAIRQAHPDVFFFSAKGDPAKWNTVSPVPLLPDENFGNWRAYMRTTWAPTSGSSLMYFLLSQCRPRRLDVYGCDSLKSRVWTSKRAQVHAACHSPAVETNFYERIRRAYPMVRILDYGAVVETRGDVAHG